MKMGLNLTYKTKLMSVRSVIVLCANNASTKIIYHIFSKTQYKHRGSHTYVNMYMDFIHSSTYSVKKSDS